MKTIKFITIALSIVTLIFTGCDKNVSFENDNNLEFAGIEHNEGLNFILHELKTKSQNLKKSNDIISIVKQSTFDYLKENSDLAINNSNDAVKIANLTFEWAKNNYEKSTDNDVSPTLYNEIYSTLSPKQKKLLSIIDNAINDSSLDLEQTLLIFEDVRSRANNELTDEERIPIIAAIEIGTNSLSYWNENIDKWLAVFSNNKVSDKKIDWKKIGGADIKGAVIGAVKGAITGAGAGVSALAGGLGASAGEAAI